MNDMLVGQLVGMALTGIIGWLGGKLKQSRAERESERLEREKELQALKASLESSNAMLKILLSYRLRDLFEKFVVGKEPITSAEKNEIEATYKYYHESLGGNGEGTRQYNELMALKTT